MKLSFSTRGWMDMHWEEMLTAAREMGFAGIEMYNVFKTPELTGKGGPLHKYSVASTVRELREKQLQTPCFDSSKDITTAEEADLEAIRQEMQLAADLRSPYVAVWASGEEEEDIQAAEENLKEGIARMKEFVNGLQQ